MYNARAYCVRAFLFVISHDSQANHYSQSGNYFNKPK